MSVHVSSACKRLDYRGAKREVLLEYADYANDDGVCYPSRARIMYNTGLSESAVKQHTKELREAGVLAVIDHQEGGRGRVPVYKVSPEKGPQKAPFKEWCEERDRAREKGSKGPTGDPERGQDVTPEPSGGTVSNYEEAPYGPSSADSESEDPSPPVTEEPEPKPQRPGAYGVAQLVERVKAARARGAPIHDPPEVANYGRFFATRFKRHDVDVLLLALDYLVAKASGEIPGEKKAWCGFDTALDAVLAGWRPKEAVSDAELERIERENVVNDRMLEDLLRETG